MLPEFVGGRFARRIGVALGVTAATVLVFGAVASVQASSELERDVQTDLRTIADTRASQLDTWIAGLGRGVATASDHPAFRGGSERDAADVDGAGRAVGTATTTVSDGTAETTAPVVPRPDIVPKVGSGLPASSGRPNASSTDVETTALAD